MIHVEVEREDRELHKLQKQFELWPEIGCDPGAKEAEGVWVLVLRRVHLNP